VGLRTGKPNASAVAQRTRLSSRPSTRLTKKQARPPFFTGAFDRDRGIDRANVRKRLRKIAKSGVVDSAASASGCEQARDVNGKQRASNDAPQ
jgi:hypothetical protein